MERTVAAERGVGRGGDRGGGDGGAVLVPVRVGAVVHGGADAVIGVAHVAPAQAAQHPGEGVIAGLGLGGVWRAAARGRLNARLVGDQRNLQRDALGGQAGRHRVQRLRAGGHRGVAAGPGPQLLGEIQPVVATDRHLRAAGVEQPPAQRAARRRQRPADRQVVRHGEVHRRRGAAAQEGGRTHRLTQAKLRAGPGQGGDAQPEAGGQHREHDPGLPARAALERRGPAHQNWK